MTPTPGLLQNPKSQWNEREQQASRDEAETESCRAGFQTWAKLIPERNGGPLLPISSLPQPLPSKQMSGLAESKPAWVWEWYFRAAMAPLRGSGHPGSQPGHGLLGGELGRNTQLVPGEDLTLLISGGWERPELLDGREQGRCWRDRPRGLGLQNLPQSRQ